MTAVGVLLAWLDRSDERGAEAKAAAESVEAVWDRIEVGTPEYRVGAMLGRKGRVVAEPGWPRRVGELPGCGAGLLREFRAAGGRTSPDVVPADREVRWRAWRVGGPRRWVAVGFLDDRSDGSSTESTVIAKRSGPGGPVPDALRD